MWYKLTYTDKGIPEGYGGVASAWFIKIRPKYRNDEGILRHELVHVHQFWRTFGLHALLGWWDSYRLKCELEAYREQLRWPPATANPEHYRQVYAGFIATKYGLDITQEEALKLIQF